MAKKATKKTTKKATAKTSKVIRAKATNYTANMLAGLVVKTIKNLALDQPYPRISQWNIAENTFDSFVGGIRVAEMVVK